MGRHDGAYDALLRDYLAGTLALPLRVLLESYLELRAAGRTGAGRGGEVTVRDPHLARLFGLGLADGIHAVRMPGDVGVQIEEARLPQALRDFFGGDLGLVPWRASPDGGRLSSTSVADGCELTLLWLGRGEPRVRYPRPGAEVALVIEGGFQDEAGRWKTGEIALRAGDGAAVRLVADEREPGCLMLLVSDCGPAQGGPLARLFGTVFDQIRMDGGVMRCSCCRSA